MKPGTRVGLTVGGCVLAAVAVAVVAAVLATGSPRANSADIDSLKAELVSGDAGARHRALEELARAARDVKKTPAERLTAAEKVVDLEVRDAKTLEFFGQLSRDPDPAIAGFGLGALASWQDLQELDKDGKTLEVVLACTDREEKQVRRNAALALRLLSTRKAVARMVDLLGDEDRLVRTVAADRLADLGAPINKEKVRDAKLADVPEDLKTWLGSYRPGESGEEKVR